MEITGVTMMDQSLIYARELEELHKNQEQLRALTHEIVLLRENERKSVSHELHEEAGQIIAGLKYRLAEALSVLPDELENPRERIRAAMDAADLAMRKIRSLANELHPPMLDVAGIHLSLQNYCDEFSQMYPIRVQYKGVEISKLGPEASIALYRILQECLTRIATYSNATQVTVVLQLIRKQVSLTIVDDGSVNYLAQENHGALGLLGIRERLLFLNGRVDAPATGLGGVSVRVSFPYPTKNAG